MRTRLIRTSVAVVLLLLLLSFQQVIFDFGRKWPSYDETFLRIGLFVAAAALGGYAVREGATFLTSRMDDPQAGVIWRNLLTWVLYAILALFVAASLGINLNSLLFGGAIIGVVIAAAAQASLGNFFAGLVLLMSRPYRIGAPMRVRFSGTDYEGMTIDQNALYLTMRLANGEILRLPNQAVITSPLYTGRPPTQATLTLTLAQQIDLDQLKGRVESELKLNHAMVVLTPKTIDGTADGKLTCDIDVRCNQPVALSVLTKALQAALRVEEPKAEAADTISTTAS